MLSRWLAGHFPLLTGSNDLSLPQCIFQNRHRDEDISAATHFPVCTCRRTQRRCRAAFLCKAVFRGCPAAHCDPCIFTVHHKCSKVDSRFKIHPVSSLVSPLCSLASSPVSSFPLFPSLNPIHPSLSPLRPLPADDAPPLAPGQAGPVCMASPPCG